VARIAEQTERRLCGEMLNGATRPESLHDPDGRPKRKCRLGKPVEFGYKAQVVGNEDGVVVDHNVEVGNQPGAAMLVPVIERVARRATRMPTAVNADHGYGEHAVREHLSAVGRARPSLPINLVGYPPTFSPGGDGPQENPAIQWPTSSERNPTMARKLCPGWDLFRPDITRPSRGVAQSRDSWRR
jgi:IS5 family transposase